MAISKVVYGTNILIDLTADTVTAGTLINGQTAHSASGAGVTGTLKRAYSFAKTDGDYAVFCLPISGSSVTSEAWTAAGVGASVSGQVMTIAG